MKKLIIYVIAAILFSISCKRSNQYPGYSLTETGIFFKLHSFGESTTKPQVGDFITVDISYLTIEDSIFFRGRRTLQVTEPTYEGSIDECFLMLAMEESASFIISADDFFSKTLEAPLPAFIKKNSDMRVDLKIIDIQTGADFAQEKKAFLKWSEDFEEYEKLLLDQYLEENKINAMPTESGLYFIPLKSGSGKKVERGDTLLVHYEGKFLDGKYFDSTKKRNQAFQFIFGQQLQVIKGLEEAFGMMKEGESAMVILPSQIAFGKQGSSSGIIPPYTTVIYEVELLSIN